MAKSIYDILSDLTTETSVPDYGSIEHTLPRQLLPTAKEFEDSEKLLAWAESNNFTHAVLQKGIQKFLIDLRATFKAVKKNEVWNYDVGQKNVDTAKWNITKRPQVNDKEEIKKLAIFKANLDIAKAMQATKVMDDKMILTTLTSSCGQEMAEEIMNRINTD